MIRILCKHVFAFSNDKNASFVNCLFQTASYNSVWTTAAAQMTGCEAPSSVSANSESLRVMYHHCATSSEGIYLTHIAPPLIKPYFSRKNTCNMLKWVIISQLCAKQQTLLIQRTIIGVYSNEYTGSICDQSMTDSPFTRNLHVKKFWLHPILQNMLI